MDPRRQWLQIAASCTRPRWILRRASGAGSPSPSYRARSIGCSMDSGPRRGSRLRVVLGLGAGLLGLGCDSMVCQEGGSGSLRWNRAGWNLDGQTLPVPDSLSLQRWSSTCCSWCCNRHTCLLVCDDPSHRSGRPPSILSDSVRGKMVKTLQFFHRRISKH